MGTDPETTAPSRRGTILATCRSDERGVAKTPVEGIELLAGHGVRDDAHAGQSHREVSLLADESAEVMRARGVAIGPGALGENLVTRGIRMKDLPLGARLRIGREVLFEITQIGKREQEPNAIQAAVGDSIMLSEGIFCRVLAGGRVRAGDPIESVVVNEEASAPQATILAVCVSDRTGIQKTPVEEIELVVEHGIRGDAHAGDWHRQVSLLADESAEVMREKGLAIGPGAFGENIVTVGVTLPKLPLGTRLRIGSAGLLEVTQIGKTCHKPCAIGRQTGECIMPREGIFCRVLAAGRVMAGDRINVIPHRDSGVE